jgi:hypothetical protein
MILNATASRCRREKFLAEMEKVVPWAELMALIEPYYPKAANAGGRPAVDLERASKRRIELSQLWLDSILSRGVLGNGPVRARLCGGTQGRRGGV